MPLDKALRSLWKAAGYHEPIGSWAVLPPPERHLLRVYHLTSAAHATSAVALRRLKVSRLSDLNDPFEFMGLMWRDLRLREKVQALKSSIDRDSGLICFSSDWTNPVLWSHYADKHRGVCLGFNLLRAEAKPVVYQDERLVGNDAIPSLASAELQEQLLLTKFRHWQYESEVRLRVPLADAVVEGPLHFKPFGADLSLAEVILGDQCTLPLDAVRTLVSTSEPRAVTFRARLAGKSYNVVPDGKSVP